MTLNSSRKVNKTSLPQIEELKRGRLAKAFDLYHDYKKAIADTFKYVKIRPIRATFQLTTVSLILFASNHNPDFKSYCNTLLEASNQHSLISDLIRNKNSKNEITKTMKFYSEERLTRWNFGLFSLIMLDSKPIYFDGIEKHCKEVGLRWIYLDDWKQRFVDIGFMDRWFILKQIMLDFDINEEDYL